MADIGVANLVEEYGRQTSVGVFQLLGATNGSQAFYQAISRGMLDPFFVTFRTQSGAWMEGTASLNGTTGTLTVLTIQTNSSGTTSILDLGQASVLIYNQVPAENLIYRDSDGYDQLDRTTLSVTSSAAVSGDYVNYELDAASQNVTLTFNATTTRGVSVKVWRSDNSGFSADINDGVSVVRSLSPGDSYAITSSGSNLYFIGQG